MLSNFFSLNNGVRRTGRHMLSDSPLLFNVYIDDLSVSIPTIPVGCCCGKTVVITSRMLMTSQHFIVHTIMHSGFCI